MKRAHHEFSELKFDVCKLLLLFNQHFRTQTLFIYCKK